MVNIIEHIRNFSNQINKREFFRNLSYLLSIFKKSKTFNAKSNSISKESILNINLKSSSIYDYDYDLRFERILKNIKNPL